MWEVTSQLAYTGQPQPLFPHGSFPSQPAPRPRPLLLPLSHSEELPLAEAGPPTEEDGHPQPAPGHLGVPGAGSHPHPAPLQILSTPGGAQLPWETHPPWELWLCRPPALPRRGRRVPAARRLLAGLAPFVAPPVWSRLGPPVAPQSPPRCGTSSGSTEGCKKCVCVVRFFFLLVFPGSELNQAAWPQGASHPPPSPNLEETKVKT